MYWTIQRTRHRFGLGVNGMANLFYFGQKMTWNNAKISSFQSPNIAGPDFGGERQYFLLYLH